MLLVINTYTSLMFAAGVFARRIRAKRLVLTHFSPRYAGDSSEASMRTMWRIEDLARNASGLQGPFLSDLSISFRFRLSFRYITEFLILFF